jgi:hypothetical protein
MARFVHNCTTATTTSTTAHRLSFQPSLVNRGADELVGRKTSNVLSRRHDEDRSMQAGTVDVVVAQCGFFDCVGDHLQSSLPQSEFGEALLQLKFCSAALLRSYNGR